MAVFYLAGEVPSILHRGLRQGLAPGLTKPFRSQPALRGCVPKGFEREISSAPQRRSVTAPQRRTIRAWADSRAATEVGSQGQAPHLLYGRVHVRLCASRSGQDFSTMSAILDLLTMTFAAGRGSQLEVK